MLFLREMARKNSRGDTAAYLSLPSLLEAVRGCRVCEQRLPMGPRPVLVCDERARILIVGQAPGRLVHETGIPWNDPSGERLRKWMGVGKEIFYDSSLVAIIPMGYCYPGTGVRGDLPPRKECAPLWFGELLNWLPRVDLCLLVGQYSQWYFLGKSQSLTERVASWRRFSPGILPLPHPSPRNALWFKKNPWFSNELIPDLRARVQDVLSSSVETG